MIDWAMIGGAVGVATLSATLITLGFVIYDVTRPERRRRRIIKDLGWAYFIVPHSFFHSCDYARQNELEHRVREIIVRPDRSITIDLVVVPKVESMPTDIHLAAKAILTNREMDQWRYKTNLMPPSTITGL